MALAPSILIPVGPGPSKINCLILKPNWHENLANFNIYRPDGKTIKAGQLFWVSLGAEQFSRD